MLAERGGRLLVDDTQALGILGPGGAGTPTWGAPRGTVLRLASLSKAFNAPLAVLSGSRSNIEAFRDASFTRVYCGPPSLPAALAASRALALNAILGGHLRTELRTRILTFRRTCAELAVPLAPGLFPVQTVMAGEGRRVTVLAAALAARGMHVFVSRGFHDRGVPRLRLIVTAAHHPATLREAAALLSDVLRTCLPVTTEDAYA
jgi:8-amino-7-oxononanoate synthase